MTVQGDLPARPCDDETSSRASRAQRHAAAADGEAESAPRGWLAKLLHNLMVALGACHT